MLLILCWFGLVCYRVFFTGMGILSWWVYLFWIGLKLKGLIDAAKNYHAVLAENRRLYNEVQDLKGKHLVISLLGMLGNYLMLLFFYWTGNIRVYCRIRPFLKGQNKKQTTIEYIGENGELVVVNPVKQGKDGHRLFKFNKVFSPEATQGHNFLRF